MSVFGHIRKRSRRIRDQRCAEQSAQQCNRGFLTLFQTPSRQAFDDVRHRVSAGYPGGERRRKNFS